MIDTAMDWADLAFTSKKGVRDLAATFIAAPRELTAKRFSELVKTYLPAGNIIVGISKDPYVLGFEDQSQFRTLRAATIQKVVQAVNTSNQKYKIYILEYFQRETKFILEKLRFKRVIFINGSWKHAFHHTEAYATLAMMRTPYELVSPFCDEKEAKEYETRIMPQMLAETSFPEGPYSDMQMIELTKIAARLSFDYSFQTGVIIGRRRGKHYDFITYAFNKVVPYQTYAMLHGASRERHFSPPHDLSHYDTVHAEVAAMIKTPGGGLDLRGATLFTNLLPCPQCSRMLCETDLSEIVYSADHSDGYAIQLLEAAGKKVRRVV